MNAARFAPALVAIAALALGAFAALGPSPAFADNAVTNIQATTSDPREVVFTARVTAPAGLESATLVYRVLNPKEGDVGGRGDATFGPGPENDVRFTLETRNSERYIPVGSQFRFHWEFTDTEGQTFQSEEHEYLFLDGRYRWNEKQLGHVTVYWYGGNEDFADRVLNAGESALEEAEHLLQVTVPYDVRIMVWESEDDGDLAMRPRSRAFDQLVRTGGQRTGPDLLFVFTATSDVVRHEMAHIVTAVAGDGPFTRIPSWLDEGTAVYMQRSPRPYDSAIAFRLQTDSTLRLRNMDSPSNNPGQVDLFYGQSWSTVSVPDRELGRGFLRRAVPSRPRRLPHGHRARARLRLRPGRALQHVARGQRPGPHRLHAAHRRHGAATDRGDARPAAAPHRRLLGDVRVRRERLRRRCGQRGRRGRHGRRARSNGDRALSRAGRRRRGDGDRRERFDDDDGDHRCCAGAAARRRARRRGGRRGEAVANRLSPSMAAATDPYRGSTRPPGDIDGGCSGGWASPDAIACA